MAVLKPGHRAICCTTINTRFILVICCILVTAVATVVGATFPQTLVDDYIIPMLASGSQDFSGLARQICSAGLRHGGGRCGRLRL